MDNSSWFSRNMILSGSVILAFWDCIFMTSGCQKWSTNTLKWIHWFYKILHWTSGEIWEFSPYRNLPVCHLLLSLHLLHGFNSSMQLVGFNINTKALTQLGYAYVIVIPVGLISLYYFIISNYWSGAQKRTKTPPTTFYES
jgi:succinate dehydrogenase / fumarate reductase cytochrome b subunit